MSPLKIISLGGFGKVTSNMFVYEYEDDILLVDCGMGFPTEDMLGIDLLIPDISYLKNKIQNIRGMVLTHGHEDHVGGLPYILPKLPNVPVYSNTLTAHLVMNKLAEYENMPKQVAVLRPGEPLTLGKFTVTSARVSHSIPDTTNLIINTPAGTVYHGSDFKFDFTPVDGKLPEIGRIAAAGNSGIKLLLSDSLGSERKGLTPSEKTLDDMFEREISSTQGKVIITSMGSNISRFQQAINTAVRHGRRVAVLGRSIIRNLEVAEKLGFIHIPKGIMIDSKLIRRQAPRNICIIAAGSQGQTGSAMDRLASGEHRDAQVAPGDKVIFSSDDIPGTETATQSLIDVLSKLGATVVYSSIRDNMHVSGHGSQQDLLLMIALTRPEYLLPIGGTYRHMVQYSHLAQSMGYSADKILLPNHNQTIEIVDGQVRMGTPVEVKNVMVDGLGVGDVGNIVLRDRQLLAEEGVVVAVIEANQNDFSKIERVDLISRGFVFGKENTALFRQATDLFKKAVAKRQGKIENDRQIRELAAEVFETFFYQKTLRRPMILPVVVEV